MAFLVESLIFLAVWACVFCGKFISAVRCGKFKDWGVVSGFDGRDGVCEWVGRMGEIIL